MGVRYDAILPCHNITPADTAKGQRCLPYGTTGSIYTDANFTGVLPWPAFSMGSYMDEFEKLGLQVIKEFPTDADVANFKNHPSMVSETAGW